MIKALLICIGVVLSTHVVKLNQDKKIEIPLNAEINVHLNSQISTGYKWHLKNFKPGVIEKENQEEIIEDNTSGIGGKEITVFTLKAKKPGTQVVEFEYWQPFDSESPTKLRKLEITVK